MPTDKEALVHAAEIEIPGGTAVLALGAYCNRACCEWASCVLLGALSSKHVFFVSYRRCQSCTRDTWCGLVFFSWRTCGLVSGSLVCVVRFQDFLPCERVNANPRLGYWRLDRPISHSVCEINQTINPSINKSIYWLCIAMFNVWLPGNASNPWHIRFRVATRLWCLFIYGRQDRGA